MTVFSRALPANQELTAFTAGIAEQPSLDKVKDARCRFQDAVDRRGGHALEPLANEQAIGLAVAVHGHHMRTGGAILFKPGEIIIDYGIGVFLPGLPCVPKVLDFRQAPGHPQGEITGRRAHIGSFRRNRIGEAHPRDKMKFREKSDE